MLKRLQMFLVNMIGVDNEKAGEFSGYVQKLMCHGCGIQEILNIFQINHVLVSSEKQLKDLVLLLCEFWNDTRMRINRGHKPNELAYNNTIKIVPAGSRKDNIIDLGQKTKNKIYPNDLCPCGSGKKYKKCCGKKRNGKTEGNG